MVQWIKETTHHIVMSGMYGSMDQGNHSSHSNDIKMQLTMIKYQKYIINLNIFLSQISFF